jgi:hypothetical protein
MIRTRGFVRAATLVLCFGLVGIASAQAPAESVLVMRVDVAGIVGSDLYKQLAAKFGDKMSNTDPKYLEFKQATGMNPEVDLRSMTLGMAGDFGAPNPKVYCILEGNFDAGKIEAYAKSSGKLAVSTKAGLTAFTPTEADDSPPPTFAVLDKNTLILATSEEFESLAGVAKSGGVPMSAALKGVLGSDKGHVLIAVVLPAQAKEQLTANPQMAPLANVQTFVLSADLSSGVSLALKAAADSEANGKGVYDAVNAFIAIGKMMSAQQPAFQKVMNDLKLEQQGATTSMSLSVKAEEVVDLVGQAMAMSGGAAPAPEYGEEEEEEEEEAPAEATPSP